MQAPQGFQYDANTGLYYREDAVQDGQSGAWKRRVYWFDPKDGSQREILYPMSEGVLPPMVVQAGTNETQPTKKRRTGCVVAVVVLLVLGLVGAIVAVLLAFGFFAGAGILASGDAITATLDEVVYGDAYEVDTEESEAVPDEGDATVQELPMLGGYYYELADSGLFAYFHFNEPTEGLVTIDMDFGGSTYTIESAYFIEGETVTLVLDDGFEAIGWNGTSVFLLSDEGLTLMSEMPFGILDSGVTLLPVEDDSPQSDSEADAFAPSMYLCTDPDLPSEYRPYIEFHTDETFYMFINMGEGVYDAQGVYSIDEATGHISLVFHTINGNDPGENNRVADVQIMDENTLYFATEGFGLMGYGNNEGIFVRQ